MAKMTASTHIIKGSLWLYLDNQQIMSNTDAVEVELEEGKDYIIHWFVKGGAGTQYSLTISSPKEAQFHLNKMLQASGKDVGSLQFGA
ncbi:MAG TPA: hypothetical protein DGG95_14875 [Cytophagales bacterium]|jgi:hypothetical protein|nr:hypothetical protein [Cytophagales bacterium]